MRPADNQPKHPITPATVAIYAIAALIVGALGSAQMYRAGIMTEAGGSYLMPVLLVGEVLVYCTLMLAQFGVAVTGLYVFLGVVVGVIIRGLMAALGAIAGAPKNSESFGQAFSYYHDSYYMGALLQILISALFIWLIRGLFEPPKQTLVAPQSDVPDMDPARLRGLHRDSTRRQELIDELRRPEFPQPEPSVVETPKEPVPVVLAPRVVEAEVDVTIPDEEYSDDKVEDFFVAKPDETEIPAEILTDEAQIEEISVEPDEIFKQEEQPVLMTLDEETETEALGDTEAQVEDEIVEEEVIPVDEIPVIEEAPKPQRLTPQQSVMEALREDDDDDDVIVSKQVTRPVISADPPAMEEVRPVPGTLPITVTNPPVTNSATFTTPAPPVALETLVAEIGEVIVNSGVPRVLARLSRAGRATAICTENFFVLDDLLANVDKMLNGSEALCVEANFGSFMELLGRHESGCIGGILLSSDKSGVFTVVDFPRGTNLGLAGKALAGLREIKFSGALPIWPQAAPFEGMPAVIDVDLAGRVLPLLEWVPETAGMEAACISVGGRQVLLLDNAGTPGAMAGAALLSAVDALGDLCEGLGLKAPEISVWSGEKGAVVSSAAQLAGQHLTVGLVHRGTGPHAQASMQLTQIISGLNRVAGG